MINLLAVKALGFEQPEAAIGETFYAKLALNSNEAVPLTIVGVTDNINIMGLFNKTLPQVYYVQPQKYKYLSIKLANPSDQATRDAIDEVWQRLIPEYPKRRGPIVDVFNTLYYIFVGITAVSTLFATLALVLALAGLFGLAALMAQRRTKEISLRKVMGARHRSNRPFAHLAAIAPGDVVFADRHSDGMVGREHLSGLF